MQGGARNDLYPDESEESSDELSHLTFNLFESYKDYAHYTSCPSCPSYVHWSQSKKARVEMGRRRELTLYSKNKYKYKFI